MKQLGEEERTQLVVEDANDEHDQVAPRPSQQWEIVPMDTIDEDEERSQASTLQSLRGQSSGEHGSSKRMSIFVGCSVDMNDEAKLP